jgi:hypothetical protein
MGKVKEYFLELQEKKQTTFNGLVVNAEKFAMYHTWCKDKPIGKQLYRDKEWLNEVYDCFYDFDHPVDIKIESIKEFRQLYKNYVNSC